jgi:glycosyltransferase involved in cell wall biosynthesis
MPILFKNNRSGQFISSHVEPVRFPLENFRVSCRILAPLPVLHRPYRIWISGNHYWVKSENALFLFINPRKTVAVSCEKFVCLCWRVYTTTWYTQTTNTINSYGIASSADRWFLKKKMGYIRPFWLEKLFCASSCTTFRMWFAAKTGRPRVWNTTREEAFWRCA